MQMAPEKGSYIKVYAVFLFFWCYILIQNQETPCYNVTDGGLM